MLSEMCEAFSLPDCDFKMCEALSLPDCDFKMCEAFPLPDCDFKVQKSKNTTGRVVVSREFCIQDSYTFEVSFLGGTVGSDLVHFNLKDLQDLGKQDLGKQFTRALQRYLPAPDGEEPPNVAEPRGVEQSAKRVAGAKRPASGSLPTRGLQIPDLNSESDGEDKDP
ncbi:hypothetical protein T484DRAFT_1788341 [Baffinella frigidus]|nr:hypothetical protein T484DRAFT_1788341 [Cryptophyta sp. CCMP2293]